MVNVQAAPDPFARASGKRGLGLALLLVTAPAPGGGKASWPTFQPQEIADLIALLQSIRRAQ